MHSSLGNSPRWRWMIVSTLLLLLMVTTGTPMASGQTQTASCTNLIMDSGFETGAGWTQQSQGTYELFSNYRVHLGQRAAHLAGFNQANDRISTTLTVPAQSTSLSFWWYAETEEDGAGTDWLRAQITNSSGTPLTTLMIVSDEHATSTWQNVTFSLKQFAGQTIQIHFLAHNDETLETDFFIDDVVAASCTGGEDEFRLFLPQAER